MVRDGNGRGTRVEARPGVVGAQDPLDDDREAGQPGQPFDGSEGDRRVLLGAAVTARGLEIEVHAERVSLVAHATTEHRCVTGQDESPAARLRGTRHQVGRPRAITQHVHLEPPRRRSDGTRDIFDRDARAGGHHHQGAGPGSARRGGRLAFRSHEALIPDRRHEDRRRDRSAEDGGRGVDHGDVAQHPGPQPQT